MEQGRGDNRQGRQAESCRDASSQWSWISVCLTGCLSLTTHPEGGMCELSLFLPLSLLLMYSHCTTQTENIRKTWFITIHFVFLGTIVKKIHFTDSKKLLCYAMHRRRAFFLAFYYKSEDCGNLQEGRYCTRYKIVNNMAELNLDKTEQDHFQVNNSVYPANFVINIKMALGGKNVPNPCTMWATRTSLNLTMLSHSVTLSFSPNS